MNKKLLTQSGLIIIGLMTAYKAIDQVLALLLLSFYGGRFSGTDDGAMLVAVLILLVYLTITFFCFRYSDQFSRYITQHSFAGDETERVNLNLDLAGIIRVALIIISLNIMILQLDDFFTYILTMFRTEGRDIGDTDVSLVAAGQQFKISLFKFVFAFLILYFAGPIARWANRVSTTETVTPKNTHTE